MQCFLNNVQVWNQSVDYLEIIFTTVTKELYKFNPVYLPRFHLFNIFNLYICQGFIYLIYLTCISAKVSSIQYI